MPTFDYRCNKCGFTDEYNTSPSLPKGMQPPEDLKCPNTIETECKDGKTRNYKCKGTLEKLFTAQNQSFDIVGFCYENEWGKKAFQKNMSQAQYGRVLAGDENPY